MLFFFTFQDLINYYVDENGVRAQRPRGVKRIFVNGSDRFNLFAIHTHTENDHLYIFFETELK